MHSLSSPLPINLSKSINKIIGYAEKQTWDGCVGSTNATSVLCRRLRSRNLQSLLADVQVADPEGLERLLPRVKDNREINYTTPWQKGASLTKAVVEETNPTSLLSAKARDT